jgi:CheY-like chemotaxis protein
MHREMKSWKVVRIIDTILLIDGDPATRDALKFILELNGYRVIEAHHGIEALQVLCEWGEDIQLALCAPELPDMTGGEWMGQMRFLGPEIPAILLSEKEMVETADLPLAPWYGGMPAQPPAPPRLMARIRDAMDEHFFERCARATAA